MFDCVVSVLDFPFLWFFLIFVILSCSGRISLIFILYGLWNALLV